MSQWSQPLRIETPQFGCLNTSRTVNSAMWFLNDKQLELHILGYLAKYQHKYTVELFAYSIQGNHDHRTIRFPHANRTPFERDMKARTAEAVRKYVAQYPGGPLFARRYSSQVLPRDEDIEERFFYTVLQPVQAGITERISDYPGYNCFHDAIHGIERKYKVIRWGEYRARKRYNPKLTPDDFTDVYTLKYQRLPGYEHLSQDEYARLMLSKLERRRREIVDAWKAKGHRFLTKAELRKLKPGALPRNTKQGTMQPIVLSSCAEAKQQFLEWYFGIVRWYRDASRRYREGHLEAEFPPNTYRPMGVLVAPP